MADVRTAFRTLQIFEIFSEEGAALSLSQIAARLEIPVSSCLQIVRTLVSNGYLYGFGRRQNYYPTRRLLDMMQRIALHDPWIDRIQGHLDDIRDRTGESVAIATLQGDKVVYLAKADSRHILRVTIAIGMVRPIHSTATGKALLGTLDFERCERLLMHMEFSPFSNKTLTSAESMRADLEAARLRGYYTTFSEGVEGLSGLAIPVVIDGRTFAIGVSGPSERIEPREAELAAILAGAVREKHPAMVLPDPATGSADSLDL